jgi:hypothetical protein
LRDLAWAVAGDIVHDLFEIGRHEWGQAETH